MANIIIVISGKQLSGKDTVAKILLQKLPNFRRVGIGDAIKSEYAKEKNITIEEIEANKAYYRPDLIALGDKGRAISDTFWIKKLIEMEGNLIIPDLRLKKEYAFFKTVNAFSIRVESSEENRLKRGQIVKGDDLTETDLDDISSWDYIIENNDTYDNLLEACDLLIKKINRDLF